VLRSSFAHASKLCYPSLVLHYPNFQQILRESLRLIVGEEVEARVEIGVARDGSGVGGKTCF
jgi:hexokinase